jgi:hypothetical protein
MIQMMSVGNNSILPEKKQELTCKQQFSAPQRQEARHENQLILHLLLQFISQFGTDKLLLWN